LVTNELEYWPLLWRAAEAAVGSHGNNVFKDVFAEGFATHSCIAKQVSPTPLQSWEVIIRSYSIWRRAKTKQNKTKQER
jgi:hypothetical protein